MGSDFELLGELTAIERIASNLSIRERRRLREQFGGRRWRKLKGQTSLRLRLLDMPTEQCEFAICVTNENSEDLEVWKVYQVLPDQKAAEVDCLRVVDESGEDYLYPTSRFVRVTFSDDVRARLLATAGEK